MNPIFIATISALLHRKQATCPKCGRNQFAHLRKGQDKAVCKFCGAAIADGKGRQRG